MVQEEALGCVGFVEGEEWASEEGVVQDWVEGDRDLVRKLLEERGECMGRDGCLQVLSPLVRVGVLSLYPEYNPIIDSVAYYLLQGTYLLHPGDGLGAQGVRPIYTDDLLGTEELLDELIDGVQCLHIGWVALMLMDQLLLALQEGLLDPIEGVNEELAHLVDLGVEIDIIGVHEGDILGELKGIQYVVLSQLLYKYSPKTSLSIIH